MSLSVEKIERRIPHKTEPVYAVETAWYLCDHGEPVVCLGYTLDEAWKSQLAVLDLIHQETVRLARRSTLNTK